MANKCTIYVTTACKKLQHSRANKQGNLVRYFKKKKKLQERIWHLSYGVYNMQPKFCWKNDTSFNIRLDNKNSCYCLYSWQEKGFTKSNFNE